MMMRAKSLIIALSIVTFLLTIPSLSFAQRWHYALLTEPSSYQLRWGEREPPSEDMVSMPPGLDTSRTIPFSPGCYKIGTSGFVLSYKVEDSILRGVIDVVVWDEVTGETFWNQTYNRVPKEGKISLVGLVLPSYITILRFQVSWAGSGTMFTRFSVFVVLDAPKAPMEPAWVNLLRYSCRWGRGTSNLEDAAQAITFGVFFQRPGFAYPSDTNTYWVNTLTNPPSFMLKALLDEWNAGRWTDGNCVNVSCLTMLALCRVGLDFSTRQLTGTVDPFTLNFRTNPICLIGSDPTIDQTYSPWDWTYHQVCVLSNALLPPSNTGLWDPKAAQKEDLNGNGYRNPPAHHPSHLWPEFDYWQKPRMQGASLGLVNSPLQEPTYPQHPNVPGFWSLGTWKCSVSANPWP
ncbi:MAG: hypothetical protein NZ805_09505 [Armatimonadetes bacterium]|nr:hypothetical protein [Armatimonadota bacterium]MDW8028849.1 hypothetical protein [Armatimonadota bacterium]